MWGRWPTLPNFCLEISKNNYLFKKLLKPVKNVRTLIFTVLYVFFKIKKNTWRYHYFIPTYQKNWWYDLHFLRHRWNVSPPPPPPKKTPKTCPTTRGRLWKVVFLNSSESYLSFWFDVSGHLKNTWTTKNAKLRLHSRIPHKT